MTYSELISALRKTAAPGGAYLNRMAQPIRKEDVPVSSEYANPEAVKELARQKMGPAYSPTALDITGAAARGAGAGYADIFRRGNADVANAGSAAAKGIASGVNAIGPFLRRHNPFMSPETRISLAKETFGPRLTPEQLAAKQQAVEAGKGVDSVIAAGNAERAVAPYIQEAVYNAGVPGTLLRSQLRAGTMNGQMDNAVAEASAAAKATLEAQQKAKINHALGIGAGAGVGGVAGYGIGSLLSQNRGIRLLSALGGAGLGGYVGHKLTESATPKTASNVNPMSWGTQPSPAFNQELMDQITKDGDIKRSRTYATGGGILAGGIAGGAAGYGLGALLTQSKGIRLAAMLAGAAAGGYGAGKLTQTQLAKNDPKIVTQPPAV